MAKVVVVIGHWGGGAGLRGEQFDTDEGRRADALACVKGWGCHIEDAIRNTPPDKLSRNRIQDRCLRPSWRQPPGNPKRGVLGSSQGTQGAGFLGASRVPWAWGSWEPPGYPERGVLGSLQGTLIVGFMGASRVPRTRGWWGVSRVPSTWGFMVWM
jgi:hypothetical protein